MSAGGRTEEQLREHYEVEKELADRLRSADRYSRLRLYQSVYDELFERVPHHPQLTWREDPSSHAWAIERQLRLLRPFFTPETVFLEVGAGACALASAAAPLVQRVYAVDVSEEITRGLDLPENLDVLITDGIRMPVPDQMVDVAFSNNLMEHLHPDDAVEQLQDIYRALRPGGVYVCLTPNRIGGPHDISRTFTHEATGFHLKEYTIEELDRLFGEAGFKDTFLFVGGRGHYWRSPVSPVRVLERSLPIVLGRFAKRAAVTMPIGALLGIRLVGVK